MNSLVYDSNQICFDGERFIKQVLIHVFCPFFLWLSPNLEMQGFCTKNIIEIFFNWGLHALLITMIVCVVLSPDYVEGNGDAVYLPIMLVLIHRLMVSLKYATMTESEYRKYMNCHDPDLMFDYKLQLQIVTGLLGKHAGILEFEIAAAATRMSIKQFSEICFKLENVKHSYEFAQPSHWHEFIMEAIAHGYKKDEEAMAVVNEMLVSKDVTISNKTSSSLELFPKSVDKTNELSRTTDIPLTLVCSALINRANRVYDMFSRLALGLGVGAIFLSIIQPYVITFKYTTSIYSIVFYCCGTILTSIYFFILVLFLSAAVFDMQRHWACAVELHDMIEVDNPFNSIGNGSAEYDNTALTNALNALEKDKHRYTGYSKVPLRANDHEHPPFDSTAFAWPMNSVHAALNVNSIGAYSISSKNPVLIPRPPLILFNNSCNVFSFLYTRLILKDFGLRFRFRLDIYIGKDMLVLVIYILVIMIMIC